MTFEEIRLNIWLYFQKIFYEMAVAGQEPNFSIPMFGDIDRPFWNDIKYELNVVAYNFVGLINKNSRVFFFKKNQF